MKKILSLGLVLALIFSLFGCSISDEPSAEPIDINKETAMQLPQDEKQETAQEIQTESKPQNTNQDKAEPCKLTLENSFSEYEVVVTLTLEESGKNKTYTAKDFEYADIYYLYQKDDYFNEKYQPEYKDRVTLFLYLNEPSKQNVLDTVKILEQDSRVYSACPNALEYTEGVIVIDLSYLYPDSDRTKLTKELKYYRETLLKSDKIESYSEFAYELTVKLKDRSMKNVIECIMEFKEKYNIESIAPDYDDICTDYIVVEVVEGIYGFTVDDFPYLELEKITSDIYGLYLHPEDKSIQYCMDAVSLLKKDERFINVYPHYITFAELD